MKTSINQICNALLGLFLIAFTFTACNNDSDSELGMEILPGTDLVTVKNVVITDAISAYTFSEDGIVTSENSKSLLGSINDPVFGNTTVNLGAQFRLTSYPSFGTNPVVDSTKLFLYYRNIYGDTIVSQNFKVYELESALSSSIQYTQDVDLKGMASDVLLGEIEFIPTIEIDSTTSDTLFQLLTIPLDNSLGAKLVNADSLDMITNDIFLEFFNGLYIESERNTEEGGSLLTMEAKATSSFQGSALVVYYNNDENLAEGDTLSQAFIITEFSATASSIEHDYSGSPFADNLDQEIQKENIYVQPTGGLKSRIIIDGLSSWQDSVNVAINKAEIIFQVDTVASDIENYPLPSQLLLTYEDIDGQERLPVDYYENPFFGGYINEEDYTYRFNITQHFEQILKITDQNDDDYVGNQGFYLTTGQRGDIANRVILESPSKGSGIQLSISYSKYSE